VVASFVIADMAGLYLAVELARLPILPATALAFPAGLGPLLGQMGDCRPLEGGTRLLLSFAALAGRAFALKIGAMFLGVGQMGEPYLGGDLLAVAFVVAPLLGVGTYRAPSLASSAEVEPANYQIEKASGLRSGTNSRRRRGRLLAVPEERLLQAPAVDLGDGTAAMGT
jgi:hypothetical protein